MTERQLYAFYRIGYSWLIHPELKEKNLKVLEEYNIKLSDCKTGPGLDEMGKTNLREELNVLQDMGLMDEVNKNKIEALELCRAASMKLNYISSMDNKHVKGVL